MLKFSVIFKQQALLIIALVCIQTLPIPGGQVALLGVNSIQAAKGSGKEGEIEDQLEDRVAEEAEKRLAKELEDRIEEAAKAEERLEKALADKIERQMKAEEDLQKAVEKNITDKAKAEEELAKALEDKLEEDLKAEEDFAEAMAKATEEEAKAAEDLLEQQQELLAEQNRHGGSSSNNGPGSGDDDHHDNSGPGSGDGDDNRERNNNGSSASIIAVEQDIDRDGNRKLRNEVMVMLRPEEVARAEAAGLQVSERENLDNLGLVLLKIELTENDDISSISRMVTNSVDTASVDYNHVYSLDASPASSSLPTASVSPAPASYAKLLGFAAPLHTDVKIGLIDTAIETNHPCLQTANITEKIITPIIENLPIQHGTAIASILLSNARCACAGLLSGAQLFNSAVFFSNADGSNSTSVENIVLALDWLSDQQVDIINMSFSGPPNQLLHRAVQALQTQGVIIVAAVGNAGPNNGPRYPAAYQGVVAVTAMDQHGEIYRRAVQGRHLTFTAPGVDVAVAGTAQSIVSQSGTSIAAPFVTAVLAASLSRQHSARRSTVQPSPAQQPSIQQVAADNIVSTYIQTAKDLGEPGFDPVYGYGLIQHGLQNMQVGKNNFQSTE